MSVLDRLKARKNERVADEKKGVNTAKWTPRGDIPVLVNRTQDLKVLDVELVDGVEGGMGDNIKFFFESVDNGATFNSRIFLDVKDGSRSNRFSDNLLNEIVRHLGVSEDKILSLKGTVLRAKVEEVDGWEGDNGSVAYRISNITKATGKPATGGLSPIGGLH